MKTIISLSNVSKSFKEDFGKRIEVLKNISLQISEGEFFVLVGPSGSGKSTLLRVMSGLEKEYEGKVILDSSMRPSDISFIFQQFAILPWMTVAENVELNLLAGKMPKEARRRVVMQELKSLGLEKFSNAYPKELSGGMRQRVGIARALVNKPKIIFLDEPFSELDSFTSEELRKDVLRIWQERKVTIVMVTHLVEEAIELADRIAVLTPRPARIERIFVNKMPRPRRKRTHEFYYLSDLLMKTIKP